MKKKHRLADTGKDKSVFVPQDDKIKFNLSIRERNDLTERQKELNNLILDKETKIVFVNGPAGTSKTFCAVYCALKMLNEKRVSNITYVRTVVESASRSLGALPGNSSEKMDPFLMPLMDKLDEFLPKLQSKKLVEDEAVKGVYIGHLRGASLNSQVIICDESQNFTKKEILTAVSRLGRFSKIIILADPAQSDINSHSGFMPMFDLFNDEESRSKGIHCFSFTKDDIVRSGVLRYILERIENYNINHQPKHEPMFPVK